MSFETTTARAITCALPWSLKHSSFVWRCFLPKVHYRLSLQLDLNFLFQHFVSRLTWPFRDNGRSFSQRSICLNVPSLFLSLDYRENLHKWRQPVFPQNLALNLVVFRVQASQEIRRRVASQQTSTVISMSSLHVTLRSWWWSIFDRRSSGCSNLAQTSSFA